MEKYEEICPSAVGGSPASDLFLGCVGSFALATVVGVGRGLVDVIFDTKTFEEPLFENAFSYWVPALGALAGGAYEHIAHNGNRWNWSIVRERNYRYDKETETIGVGKSFHFGNSFNIFKASGAHAASTAVGDAVGYATVNLLGRGIKTFLEQF